MNNTEKKLIQLYGPLAQKLEIEDFLWISEQAFQRMSKIIGNNEEDFASVGTRILQMQMIEALNTSLSIRILLTYGQATDAYAHLRMRLEQVIVTSYLIHIPSEKGFDLFYNDFGRVDYRAMKGLDSTPDLKKMIENIFGDKLSHINSMAIASEMIENPSFDIVNEKIKRKWTRLNTYSMAEIRDKLVNYGDFKSSIKLTWLYNSIYRNASVFLHADTGAVLKNIYDQTDSKRTVEIAYLFVVLIFLNYLDILQCYEVTQYYGKTNVGEISILINDLQQVLKGKGME